MTPSNVLIEWMLSPESKASMAGRNGQYDFTSPSLKYSVAKIARPSLETAMPNASRLSDRGSSVVRTCCSVSGSCSATVNGPCSVVLNPVMICFPSADSAQELGLGSVVVVGAAQPESYV